jgi:hypothetical protein
MSCENQVDFPKRNQEKDFPVFSDEVMIKLLRSVKSKGDKSDVVRVVNYIKEMLDEFLKFGFDDMLHYDEEFVVSGIKNIYTRIKTYLKVVYNISEEDICCYHQN